MNARQWLSFPCVGHYGAVCHVTVLQGQELTGECVNFLHLHRVGCPESSERQTWR